MKETKETREMKEMKIKKMTIRHGVFSTGRVEY
jgi:hypothetical protein